MKLDFDGEIRTISTSKEELTDSIDYAILSHTDASFWIDNRDNSKIFFILFKEYIHHKEEQESCPKEVKEEIEEQEKNATVVPECDNPKNGVVKIRYKDDILSVEYIKNDDFISIVKGLGYKWSGKSWEKSITEYTGNVQDRAAELGNALLMNGFTVQFPNADIKDMSIAENFSPENDRWVKYNPKSNRFSLVWAKRNDELYKKAKKLPGARWEGGSMKVNLEFYREVEDFANTMGFSISNKARCSIEEYKQKESEFETINITTH